MLEDCEFSETADGRTAIRVTDAQAQVVIMQPLRQVVRAYRIARDMKNDEGEVLKRGAEPQVVEGYRRFFDECLEGYFGLGNLFGGPHITLNEDSQPTIVFPNKTIGKWRDGEVIMQPYLTADLDTSEEHGKEDFKMELGFKNNFPSWLTDLLVLRQCFPDAGFKFGYVNGESAFRIYPVTKGADVVKLAEELCGGYDLLRGEESRVESLLSLRSDSREPEELRRAKGDLYRKGLLGVLRFHPRSI